VLIALAVIIGLVVLVAWARGSILAAVLMIPPMFLLASAIIIEPMLSDPNFVLFGPTHKVALFCCGLFAVFVSSLPHLLANGRLGRRPANSLVTLAGENSRRL
jgi:hypothetical protein